MSLWYADRGPWHSYLASANQTLFWSPSDTRERWDQHQKNSVTKKKLDELGWREDSISYSFNHQGFRDDQFDDRPSGLAIGCSFTQGTGLARDQLWVTGLSRNLGIHIWNLGIGGASMDTCSRILEHYLPILKPKFVVLCTPPKERFEYLDGEFHIFNALNKHNATWFPKVWFLHDENSRLQFEKNLAWMKQMAQDQSVPFFYFHHKTLFVDADARDLAHPGPRGHAYAVTKLQPQIERILT